MPKRKAGRYRDELGTPLLRVKPVNAMLALTGAMTMDQLEQEAREAECQELIRRFGLLFEHYGIKRSSDAGLDFATLAMVLAIEHVPGMRVIDQPPPKQGRPKVWNVATYMELLASIEQIKQERRCGDREACKIHLQRTTTKNPTSAAVSALNARLTDARSGKKNWLYAHLVKQYGENRDAMIASIIEHYGADRK